MALAGADRAGTPAGLASAATDGIAAVNDLIDPFRHRFVQLFFPVSGRGIGMGGRGILEDSYNFPLGQDVAVVQGKQQRFDNRKGGVPGGVHGSGHQVSTFTGFRAIVWQLSSIVAGKCRVGLICVSVRRSLLQNMAVKQCPKSPASESVAMKEPTAVLSVQDSPFARKLSAFVRLSQEEMEAMSDLYRRRRHFAVGSDMIHQGQKDQCAYVLASGWASSYKILPDGSRQIVDFQIPGDFLGLRSVLFRTSDHNVEPLTPMQASEVQQKDLLDVFGRTPRLAMAVLWAASRDEAMVVERLVDLGRRSASVRMAHFLLELGSRLRMVGLGDRTGYACPLSQYLLADALGLSAVHVNRVLRELREEGLLTFQRGRVTFDDYDALVAHADFDRAYLDLDGPLLG